MATDGMRFGDGALSLAKLLKCGRHGTSTGA